MFTTTAENKKFQGEYDDTANDLKEIEQEFEDRVNARIKRDEISAIMERKKAE